MTANSNSRAHLLGACCDVLASALAVHEDTSSLNDQVHVLQANEHQKALTPLHRNKTQRKPAGVTPWGISLSLVHPVHTALHYKLSKVLGKASICGECVRRLTV